MTILGPEAVSDTAFDHKTIREIPALPFQKPSIRPQVLTMRRIVANHCHILCLRPEHRLKALCDGAIGFALGELIAALSSD